MPRFFFTYYDMSALKIFDRSKHKQGVKFCVNECVAPRGGKKAARKFATIASYPVGYLCDDCAKKWQEMWAEYSSDEAENISA